MKIILYQLFSMIILIEKVRRSKSKSKSKIFSLSRNTLKIKKLAIVTISLYGNS